MDSKKRAAISISMMVVLALALGSATAKDEKSKDIKTRGSFAGTFLTSRIDLNNDGNLAGWTTAILNGTLGQFSSQGIVERTLVDPPTGKCPAGQLEFTLLRGNAVATNLETTDQLFSQLTEDFACVDPATGAFSGKSKGKWLDGTGRFAGASGTFEQSFAGFNIIVDQDPASRQAFGSFSGEATGRITLKKEKD